MQITPAHDIWYVLDRYGLPVFLLAIVGGFGYRILWPFLVKQLDDAKQELKVQSQAFLEALARRDQIMKSELDELHKTIKLNFDKIHARLDRDRTGGRSRD